MKVTDPVCKMVIDDKDAVATSTYKGITYYFCSKACKEDFDKNPESFISRMPKMEEMIAAIAEKGSEHPLAEAIIKRANMMGLSRPDYETFEAIPGHGVMVVYEGKEILIGNRRLMKDRGIPYENKEAIISDLEEKGNTVMIVAREKKLMGFIAVADTLKENAGDVIKGLKTEKIEVIMLTGDNERTAKAIGNRIGIEKIISVLPVLAWVST
ncbi:P-type Cu+ transporter, partial [Candidatus Hakubella thermalkaliphila]